ncbi:MAG: hypothetical protein RR646_01470 [Erysipelotrichaceae bacterium]
MSNYLTLTKVLLKTNFGTGKSDSSSRFKTAALYVLIAICFFPVVAMLYDVLSSIMPLFVQIQQESFILSVALFASTSITFAFSLFIVSSIYYFSKDVDHLLPLPLKPETIILSKFSVALIYEYIVAVLVMGTTMAAYFNCVGFDALKFIISILVTILLPILPLCLSSILTILLMRFVPLAKNRDLFNMIGSIAAVAISFGFSFILQKLALVKPEEIVKMIQEGKNSLNAIFYTLAPNVPFAANAITAKDIISLLVYIGITLLAFIIFILVAKNFYFKGAIGVNESNSSKTVLSAKELSKGTRSKPVVFSYMIKEIKLLLRTPIYFMNNILIVIIMPICLVVPFVSTDAEQLNEIAKLAQILFSNDNAIYLFIIGGIGLGLFYSNMDLIASTSISREGSNFKFMKYIPISYMDQINAKVLSGFVIGEFGMLIVLIPIAIFLKIPLLLLIIGIVAASISNLLGNYLGIIIDILHPKLTWESEAAAVKQNMNGMLAMLMSFVLGGIVLYVCFIFDIDQLHLIALTASLLVLILLLITYQLLRIKADALFSKM